MNVKVKKIAVVSLSSGILGEDGVQHSCLLGEQRLKDLGLELMYMPYSKKGVDYLHSHPQKRAQDLLQAMQVDSVDMILCAIGGNDTYRLLPYLFGKDELKNALREKIFLGFSDTTWNHFMLYKLGLKTFYGQAFLTEVCELAEDMLPYSKEYFEELLQTGKILEMRPSETWYLEREDFSERSIGVDRPSFPDEGFQLLRGKAKFSGIVLGGCIESLYDMVSPEPTDPVSCDAYAFCQQYQLFPSKNEWAGKILFIETSEEKPNPMCFRTMIRHFEQLGIFDVVEGVLVGKPQDNVYHEEYKQILLEEISNEDLSIVTNLNVGHALPRAILPLGEWAYVDIEHQVIQFGGNK